MINFLGWETKHLGFVMLILGICNAQDAVQDALCTGVNINEPHIAAVENIFVVCPTSVEVRTFIDNDDTGRTYKVTDLGGELKEGVNPNNELVLGAQDFVGQLWLQNPAPMEKTPFNSVSNMFASISFTPNVARNILFKGGDPRLNAYKEMVKKAGEALYVVGRNLVLEHFSVEWNDNPTKFHLSAYFLSKMRELENSAASIDGFIKDFGTHYRRSVTFGGQIGTDFYFNKYGTRTDRINAMQHVNNADLVAAQNESYVVPFVGFDVDPVLYYSWSKGGSDLAMKDGLNEWIKSVNDNVGILYQELAPLSDLFEVSGVPHIYSIIDKWEERIGANALAMTTTTARCLYNGHCRGNTCMGNTCVDTPVAPRWPNMQRYCLPKPVGSRCPSPDYYDEFTDDTWVYWDTENGAEGEEYKYFGADHLTSQMLTGSQIPVEMSGQEGRGGVKMFFCCLKQPELRSWERTDWPKGSYCIFAHPSWSILMSRVWSFDSILWNDEDTNNKNDFQTGPHFGSLPMGHYHSSYTEQKLMCRDDGDPSKPITLPKEFPFYLVQNGETCQTILGMQSTYIEIVWDAENQNRDRRPTHLDDRNSWVKFSMWKRMSRDCTPKKCVQACEEKRRCIRRNTGGPDNRIVMYFCHYEEIRTPSPTPMPTPSPTPPTVAPTTDAPTPQPPTPTPPPTPPPPTKKPTPYPTRPTPSPINPTPPPTPRPTPPPPTPWPTKQPTPAPTPPTPAPTKRPTPAPTPAPTTCDYCDMLGGVNIVGLHSTWPGDKQPERDIFSSVSCDCGFCKDNLCETKENCEVELHMGDAMLLRKFWLDRPIALESDDYLFLRTTWEPVVKDGPKQDFFSTITIDALRKGFFMDLSHARNALLYGGSDRMQDYGRAHSLLFRHIGSNFKDKIYAATHWTARNRYRTIAEVERLREPYQSDFTGHFDGNVAKLHQAINNEQNQRLSEKQVDDMFDKFISDYGTHYIWSADVGGEYGADWFFSGYGTKVEMSMGLRDVKNADLPEMYERSRFKDLKAPLKGGGFVRVPGGEFLHDNDVKGWMNGGDPYGVRGRRGHEAWERGLDRGENVVILHYKKLISIGKLLIIITQPSYVTDWESHKSLILERFKTRVYEKAYLWLVLHYMCFTLQRSCENERRHPFLREAANGNCNDKSVPRTWLRSRTEMETCIGQANQQDGYLLRSESFPFNPVQWCEGSEVNDHPSNYPPYVPVRRAFCPVVPPTPRWPNAHSWCLPKPLERKGSTQSNYYLECPKEHHPEYEWNWDWQGYIQDAHDHDGQFEKVASIRTRAGAYSVNPTNRIWSLFPWQYHSNDYYPRTTPYPEPNTEISRPTDAYWHTCETLRVYLSKYTGDMIPQKTACYGGDCDYEVGYMEYPLYPVNKVYVRVTAPFLQEIGWAFWDTEDDTDSRPIQEMQYAIDPTPTHMDVAEHFKAENDWDVICNPNDESVKCKPATFTALDKRKGGKKSVHSVEGFKDLKYRLWEPPALPSFKTGGTRMQYCCTTINEGQAEKAAHFLHWPNGHLCIYAHGAVDSTIYEFKQGSIGWDCENGAIDQFKYFGNKIYSDSANDVFASWDEVATQQRLTHSLPTGLYHIQYDGKSEQYFSQNVLCMALEPDPLHFIELPRDMPFYLMRKAKTCQAVTGMFFTEVSLTYHTELNHKTKWVETPSYDKAFVPLEMNSWGRDIAYGRRDQIPDGHYGQDYIQIWYCFYQPLIKWFENDSGPQPYFNINVPSVGPMWNQKPTLDQVSRAEIIAMDPKGRYSIEWPKKPNPNCD